MNDQQLAEVLDAFMSRLTLGQLHALVAAQDECMRAALYYGASAQLEAHEKSTEAARKAVRSIAGHDKQLIAGVIQRSIENQ